MAQNSVDSKLEEGASGKGKWTIYKWNASHKLVVAANASCLVEVGSPKVGLRFFLRSKEKIRFSGESNKTMRHKWYALCAEVLDQVNEKAAIEITATAFCDFASLASTTSGTIVLNKSKEKIVEVIDPFIYYESNYTDSSGKLGAPINETYLDPYRINPTPQKETNQKVQPAPMFSPQIQPLITDVTINITAKLFRLIESGNNVDHLDADAKVTEAEESLIRDMKNMFVAHQNYADIKLESKDDMILDAHKFILAARSPFLQKCIDDAAKTENFNGTMKMKINGKPLVVILHWLYTGELHENAGNVMEEVVDAAILFELTQLMKILDKKLITICSKENMFHLYQVAQKNVMPNAMNDISAYIRDNL